MAQYYACLLVDTERKLNVLCTINLRPVSTGFIINKQKRLSIVLTNLLSSSLVLFFLYTLRESIKFMFRRKQ